jgi:hypothetical protein
MAAQEKRIASDPEYRTSASVLRRLSAGSIVYEASGSQRGAWDRFAVRNLGLAVQRRMAREFRGNAQMILTASANQVARSLGMTPSTLRETEQQAFLDFALVLALIPDLANWTNAEKRQVVQVIRAKAGTDESRYARLLQAHQKLRAAVIRLGEAK